MTLILILPLKAWYAGAKMLSSVVRENSPCTTFLRGMWAGGSGTSWEGRAQACVGGEEPALTLVQPHPLGTGALGLQLTWPSPTLVASANTRQSWSFSPRPCSSAAAVRLYM